MGRVALPILDHPDELYTQSLAFCKLCMQGDATNAAYACMSCTIDTPVTHIMRAYAPEYAQREHHQAFHDAIISARDEKHLDSLLDSGFIHFVSRPLGQPPEYETSAERREAARAEREPGIHSYEERGLNAIIL